MATIEELKKRIEAKKVLGLPTGQEEADMQRLVARSKPDVAKLTAAAEAIGAVEVPADPFAEGEFIPLNLESFGRGGGGGWVPPKTIGKKAAVYAGWMRPERLEDQLWFLFRNAPGSDDPFYGALVTGGLQGSGEKSGAWKVKDVLVRLGLPFQEDLAQGGIILPGRDYAVGMVCEVMWADIKTKTGKTERRIQDVYGVGKGPETVI